MNSLLRWILLIAILGLAACQPGVSAPNTEGSPSSGPTQASNQAYPLETPLSGEQAYPAADAAETPSEAYPGPGEDLPSSITWEGARELILSGQVTQVSQLHDLTVTLTLADGRLFETIEPDIDDVFDVIDECGDPCSDVIVATE